MTVDEIDTAEKNLETTHQLLTNDDKNDKIPERFRQILCSSGQLFKRR